MTMPRPVASLPALLAIASLLLAARPTHAAAADPTARARDLLLHGRIVQAREAYRGLGGTDPAAAALGTARCDRAVGKLDEAARTLRQALATHPTALLRAELASLEFERGRLDSARAQVDRALAAEPELPLAHWLDAELDRVSGRLDRANEGYRWFVRLYNRDQDKLDDPEVLRLIGLAGAQFARWNRSSGQFHFLVNTLYPDVLERDAAYWPANLEAALLFTEKYNRKAALEEVQEGLAIDPGAAELHAARAAIALQDFDLDTARVAIERALARNPALLVAHDLRADLAMVAFGPREALPVLEAARALDPADEETLGRLAAVYGALDGLADAKTTTRMGAVIAEATRRNEHCGSFFAAMAASLDRLRKYPDAARYYEEARRRMPQLVAVPGQLGLVMMRLGDEARARAMLAEAFEADPFNARVKNSLDVLEVLAGYDSLETTHFKLRFDRARDSLLARRAARWLEDDVYPDVVKQLGFAPEGKSLFEIFSRANGASGHQWFSIRMTGVPFIGTVGACAGKMVAIASPNDGERRFNWARVVRHEFVHIVNLQQTGFEVPRWYTEGLAVAEEGPGTPRIWDAVLARRVASGKLFDLSTIHLGFVRPSTGEDWALAYCQAELYVRFMRETYGADAHRRMLDAFAHRLDTRGAIEKSFHVSLEAFEKAYAGYVRKIAGPAATAAAAEAPADTASSAQLERMADARPGDAALLARLARAQLDEGRPYAARSSAQKALAIDPRQAAAAGVIARVRLQEGDKAGAREAMRTAFDPAAPDREALLLMLNLALDAQDWPEAERLATLGRDRFPGAADWDAGLVAAYRATRSDAPLAALLGRRADGDPDDLDARLDLARIAAAKGDHAGAARWSEEALHVDVKSAVAHATLAEALEAGPRKERAVEEWETAVALDPGKLEWRLALAKACQSAGRIDRARQVLTELLAKDAKYPEARELLGSLGR